MNAENNAENDHKQHKGRKFRGKRLRTSLPKPKLTPEAEAPLPERKEVDRVAKVIARAGLASRREAEAWIEAGRVAVNGAVIKSPALNVGPKDRIVVDGKPLPERERTRLFLFHKPRGLVTTSADPEGRPTIFGALPKDMPRVVTVGRLDMNTEGLLLLTNDGGLARALELPATGWLRRYRVRAYGQVLQSRLDGLRNGIVVDGIRYGAIEATLDREQGDNCWITFAMREGKNREIRNVLGELGLKVNRLIRLSYGPFQLAELPAGAVEEVKTRAIREQLGERLSAIANADFSGPIVERVVEAEPQTQKPTRHPEVRGEERQAAGTRPRPTSESRNQNRPRPAHASKDQSRHRPASAPKDQSRTRPAFASKDRNRANPAAPRGAPDRSARGSSKGTFKSTLSLPNKKERGRPSFEGRRGRPPQDDGEKKHSPDNRHRGRPPHGDGDRKPPRGEPGKHRGHRGDRGRPHRGKRPR
jgi:23S rRNA pseudouridine2605 synthase